MRIVMVLVGALFVLGVVAMLALQDAPGSNPVEGVERGAAGATKGVAILEGRGSQEPPSVRRIEPTSLESEAHRVRGLVTDLDGRPLADAEVVAWLDPRDQRTKLGAARTDADGRYKIAIDAVAQVTRALRATSGVVVEATLDGYGGGATAELRPLPLNVGGGFDLVLDMQLSPGSAVRGVVHGMDDQAVAGAVVQLVRADGESLGYANTRADGTFRLAFPGEGPLDLVAQHYAHGWTSHRGLTTQGHATLDAGVLALHGVDIIGGHVRYADGSPLAGVAVIAMPSNEASAASAATVPSALNSQGYAETDADGRFLMRVNHPGEYTLSLRRFGRTAGVVISSGDLNAEIVVDAHRIVVRVLDETGRPLAGCLTQVFGWRPDRREAFELAVVGGDAGELRTSATSSMVTTGLTDPDSTLQLVVEHGSAWVFMFDVDGAPPLERVLRVPNEGHETLLDVTIPTAVPRGNLAVEVLDAYGAPIEEFDFELTTPLGTRAGSGSSKNPDSFRGLVAGPGRLRVDAGPARHSLDRTCQILSPYFPVTEEVEVRRGETTHVRVRPARGGWIQLHPELAGEPKEDALDHLRIHVRPHGSDDEWRYVGFFVYGEGEDLHATTELRPNEDTRVAQLFRPGDLELRFQGDGFKTQFFPVTVSSGTETPVRVRLEYE